jgi:hypothetical protein
LAATAAHQSPWERAIDNQLINGTAKDVRQVGRVEFFDE